MNRLERLTAIVLILQQKKIVTAKELADYFQISVRTVYRDMKSLEEAGIPLGAEAGEGYQLLEGFHLPPIMFTEAEAGALIIGGKFAEKNTDVKFSRHIESALMKIQAVLPETNKLRMNLLRDSVVITEQTPNNDGNDSDLFTIQNANIDRNCISLSYYAGSSNEKTKRIIEPIGLIHYSDHWHLIAYCRLREDYRDFRTDRIEGIKILEEKFLTRDNFSIHTFLGEQEDGINSEEFQVLFPFSVFRNISRRNLFGLTTAIIENETVRATFIVPNMQNMVNWLISFGNKITIVYPEELKQMIVKEIDIIYKHIHDTYK